MGGTGGAFPSDACGDSIADELAGGSFEGEAGLYPDSFEDPSSGAPARHTVLTAVESKTKI